MVLPAMAVLPMVPAVVSRTESCRTGCICLPPASLTRSAVSYSTPPLTSSALAQGVPPFCV